MPTTTVEALSNIKSVFIDFGHDTDTVAAAICSAFNRPTVATSLPYEPTITTTSTYIINSNPEDYTITAGRSDVDDLKDTINELQNKVNLLSKRAIPRFHCEYCGTQNFEYAGISTTPQCPNCGALMRRSKEEPSDSDSYQEYYPNF